MIRIINFRRALCLILALIMCFFCFARPVTAYATGLGAAATGVVVAAEAPLVLGAVIIALGIMVATDAGVFDGIISKCQEALASSGLINDGKMNVISVNDKAYIPENTVKAVRSALFSSTVLYEGLDRFASIKSGSTVSTLYDGTITILNDCYAFAYFYSSLSTPELVLIPYNYNSVGDASNIASGSNGDFSVKSVYVSGFGYVRYISLSCNYNNLRPFSINSITNSTSVGDAISSFFNGKYDFSPKTTVYTDYAVALGNVAPDDEDLQTGYPGWYNNAVVIEGTGGSGDDDNDGIHILGLPIKAPELSSDLETMTQEEVQEGGELIVEPPESPGGTTSGSGISETWLGQKLDALGDWLSGIKESIQELPNKLENLFSNLAEGLSNLLQPVQQILQFLTGTTYVESPLEALHFDALFSLFPFNIPYGIYQAINFWSAAPAAPTITIPLSTYDGDIGIYEYKINLSDVPGMDTLAAILRAGELILFVVGLVMITRKVTKW